MPRFSIVITCHNQAEFIADAVGSALCQRYASKEIIVVNDGSADGSRAILESFGSEIILENRATSLGANLARNDGAMRATGDYIAFLDGDDVLMPMALDVYDRVVDAIGPKLILGRLIFFQGAVPPAGSENTTDKIELVAYDSILQKDRAHRQSASSMVVERSAFWRVNGWDAGFFPYEDYDLTLRVGCSGTTLQILSPATVLYRVHGGNVTRDVRRIVGGVYQLMEKERGGGYPGGSRLRYERFAIIGGAAFGWIRRALSTGCYLEPAKLMVNAGPMIAAACVRRLAAKLKRKRPIHSIDLAPGKRRAIGAGA
jgi:glycosyltransferase involved in cell wall biosynthesis